MIKHFVFRLLLVALIAPLGLGCSTVRNAWNKTTDIYETYVDPKPEIDLQRSPGLSRNEQKLAMQFSLMDQHVEEALRVLAPQDNFPAPAWFNEFLERFPWMTAVSAVDTQGRILASHPEVALKSIDSGPLLEQEWSMLQRNLQGFAQETPLGPELIIAGPFFRDGSWQGLIVAHFDPRSLVAFATASEQLLLLTPGNLLWSGVNPEVTREILDAPWERILRNRVHGRWSSQNDTFLWISRPIGELQLIYALALSN